ncbi:MAG: class I SAM-dependent methyltransferase [Myxococcota bacterium]
MDNRGSFVSGLDTRFRQFCETYCAEPCVVEVAGLDLIIHPRVFRAEGASTTATLIEALGHPEGQRVLDMGCGTGIVGILAAQRGARSVVLADRCQHAVDNARANVVHHQLQERCEVRQSDLFTSIEGTFDLIVFNIPFLYAEHENEIELPAPEHLADALPPREAFADVGYRMIRAFMSGAKGHLAPDGAIRCTFASFGNQEVFDAILQDEGLTRRTVASRVEAQYGLEYLAYEIRRAR